MKEGLQAAKLKAHLMSQPLAFHTPDCGKQGFIDLPEFPFGKTRVSFLFSFFFLVACSVFFFQLLVKMKLQGVLLYSKMSPNYPVWHFPQGDCSVILD